MPKDLNKWMTNEIVKIAHDLNVQDHIRCVAMHKFEGEDVRGLFNSILQNVVKDMPCMRACCARDGKWRLKPTVWYGAAHHLIWRWHSQCVSVDEQMKFSKQP